MNASWNSGSWVVRSPEPADLVGVCALVDQAVGYGFLAPDDIDPRFSFLCSCEGRIVGAVVATLESYADLRVFYRGRTPLTGWGVQPEPDTVGHVREVAVLEDLRRTGLARLLLTRSETAFRERGVEVLVANAWIRRDTRKPWAASCLKVVVTGRQGSSRGSLSRWVWRAARPVRLAADPRACVAHGRISRTVALPQHDRAEQHIALFLGTAAPFGTDGRRRNMRSGGRGP